MASSATSRPASAASSASNKSGMKIKVPRPPRTLSNEQAIARQQQHAEIDQKFASGHTPRARKKPAWMHGQDLLLLCCTPDDVKIMSRGCRVHDVWFLHQVYSYASGAFYQEYDAAAAKTMAVFESWTEANNKVHGIRHRSFPTLNTRSWRNRLHAAVARCRCQLRVYRYVENVGRACLVQGLDGTWSFKWVDCVTSVKGEVMRIRAVVMLAYDCEAGRQARLEARGKCGLSWTPCSTCTRSPARQVG